MKSHDRSKPSRINIRSVRSTLPRFYLSYVCSCHGRKRIEAAMPASSISHCAQTMTSRTSSFSCIMTKKLLLPPRAHLMFNVKHAPEMRDVMSIVNHYMFYGTRNPTRKLTLLLSSSTRCLGGGRPHLGQAISRFAETKTIHFATTLTSPWATLQRQNPPCP